MVAVGSKDTIAGPPEELAALVPNAQALIIPNRDHMLAVGDKTYKAAVLEFLNKRALVGHWAIMIRLNGRCRWLSGPRPLVLPTAMPILC